MPILTTVEVQCDAPGCTEKCKAPLTPSQIDQRSALYVKLPTGWRSKHSFWSGSGGFFCPKH